eukprot:scaffold32058_cov94-Attheya_sp.AAC.1
MTLSRVDWGLLELHNPQDSDDPLPRQMGTYGVTQSTGQVPRGHFESKNHVKPLWRSKITLIIVKNGTINNFKITFSVKSAFLIDALPCVDWGLME